MTMVYRRNASIEASPMQGESLLFDPSTNRFCLLNGTAALVWDRLAQPATVEQLAAELCLRFDVPEPARVEQDVRAALERFTELALIAPEAVA
ncbi:MAG: HPr-rel-A system PqqD family peptide chaperone [Gemmatimonadales bacterium]